MSRRGWSWLAGVAVVLTALVVVGCGVTHVSVTALTADSIAAIRHDSSIRISEDAMQQLLAMHYNDPATNQPVDQSSARLEKLRSPFCDPSNVEANDFQKIVGKVQGQLVYKGLLVLCATTTQPADFKGWHLVAQAYYDGNQKDLPQNLGLQHSCIYLKDGSRWWPPKDFDSAIMPPDASDVCSPTRPDADVPVDQTRDVDREGNDDNTNANYPGTARIDWNGKDRDAIHIGVKCEQEWCDIGPKGADHSKQYKKLKRGKVKAFFDEQMLGVATPPGSANATPSATVGTIIPEDGLEGRNFDCPPTGCTPHNWVLVASVGMANTDAKYARSYNLQDADVEKNPNRVYLRRRSGPDVSKGWEARIVNASGTEMTQGLSVKYADMSSAPGVHLGARWRWRDNDESMWVRCAAGCCDINADNESSDQATMPAAPPATAGTSDSAKSDKPKHTALKK